MYKNVRLQQNSNTYLTMLAMLDNNNISISCTTMLAMLDYSKIAISCITMLDYSKIAINA